MIKDSPPLQIHSIHQRRKVVGRSKNFDQLVAELKTKVREKGAQSLEGGSSTGRSPSPEVSREAPHCRRPLASLPAFRYVSHVVKANITLSVLFYPVGSHFHSLFIFPMKFCSCIFADLVLQSIHSCITQRPRGGKAAARGRGPAGPFTSRPRPNI